MMKPYADLELEVQARADGGYTAELRYRAPRSTADANVAAELPPGQFDPQQLAEAALDPREYGRRLTMMLFADVRLRKTFVRAIDAARQAQTPLRIRLRLDQADETLNAIRWELLQDPDDEDLAFLVTSERTLFSRFPSSEDMEPVVPPPMKDLDALVAIANPSDLGRFKLASVDTAGELGRIREALGTVKTRVLAREGGERGTTLNAIVEALRDGPEVLYLVCHGTFREGKSYLWLEAEDGTVQRIEGGEFVARLKELAQRPLLVVLAACQGAGTSHAEGALAAIGPQLAAAGMASVVAMQGSVQVETVAALMPVFFTELRRDGQIDRAMAAARAAVGDRPDWWMPVLFMRVADGLIWAAPPASARSNAQKAAIGVVGVLVAAAAAVLLYVNLSPFFAPPKLMTGAFNVAVAEFGMLDDRGRSQPAPAALSLAQSVYSNLDGELRQLNFGFQVRPPAETGRIEGASREDRAKAAARLAQQINADVIVYGNLTNDGAGFVPEFYLSDRKLQQAEELVGQYELGAPLRSPASINTNVLAQQELTDRLRARSAALVQFVLGINAYALERFADAQRYFQQADTIGGLGDKDGRVVLALFLGNTAGKLGDVAGARGYYEQALGLDGEYARAQIGAAEVLFQLSRGTCEQGGVTDPAGLEQAEQRFKGVLAAKNQPALADIPAKVDYALGRVYLCQSQALLADRWAEAEQAFQRVISAYGGTNRRLLERAALAHANLGTIALPFSPSDPDAPERYRRALDAYEKGLELLQSDAAPKSEQNERLQATFYGTIGFIHGRLKAYDQADAAYNEAIRLSHANPTALASYTQQRDVLRAERP